MITVLGALFGLVAADGVISNYLITQGFAREGNPFIEQYVGTEIFLIIKTFLALFCVLVLWRLYKKSPKLTSLCTVVIFSAYAILVYWNLGLALVYFL